MAPEIPKVQKKEISKVDGQHVDPSVNYVKETTERARSGFFWIASTNIIWQAATWISTIVTIRFLTPADYGLFALADTVLPYFLIVAELSLSTWMIRVQHFDQYDEKTLFTLTVFLGAMMSLFAFSLAPLAADFYDNRDLELLLQVMSIIFLVRGIYAVPRALLHRELKFRTISIMDLSVNLSRVVLTLALVIAGMGYWALAAGTVFKELVTAVWLISARGVPRGFAVDFGVMRQAVGFGLAATGAGIFWVIYTTADEIIVGKLLGVEILGYYAMAYLLMDLPLAKINTVIGQILLPYFSRLQKHTEELFDAFLKINKGFVLLVSPILVGMAVTATEVVPLILGEKWTPMIRPLIALSLFGVIFSLTTQISPLLYALGYPKKIMFVHFMSATLLPVSFLLLGKKYGLDGIIAAWFLVFPIISMLFLRALKNTTGLTAWCYIKNLKVPLLAVSIMGIITSLCGTALSPLLPLFGLLCAKIVIGVVVYAAVLWLVFRAETSEMLSFIMARRRPRTE